jgi:hypothetical protein
LNVVRTIFKQKLLIGVHLLNLLSCGSVRATRYQTFAFEIANASSPHFLFLFFCLMSDLVCIELCAHHTLFGLCFAFWCVKTKIQCLDNGRGRDNMIDFFVCACKSGDETPSLNALLSTNLLTSTVLQYQLCLMFLSIVQDTPQEYIMTWLPQAT